MTDRVIYCSIVFSSSIGMGHVSQNVYLSAAISKYDIQGEWVFANRELPRECPTDICMGLLTFLGGPYIVELLQAF